MDNYEQKYNEILEWARKYKARLNGVPIEEVLPELAESEDERIRQAIINGIQECQDAGSIFGTIITKAGITYLDVYAWLKKQKELTVNDRGLYYYDGEKFTYCGYPATEDNPYDFAMSQQKEQKPTEKPDYSGLTDLERAIHRGFLAAGVENVSRGIIEDTAKEVLVYARGLIKDELAKKHLDGYCMGREDTLREIKDFVESHFNPNKAKEGEDLTDLYYKEYEGNPKPIPVGYNTNSGTSTLKAEG